MKIGYVRYISDNQSSDKLVNDMEKVEVDKVIFQISSYSNHQKNFKEFIQTLEKRDVLVVDSLDIIGETIKEIVENLKILNEKEIGIQILNLQPDSVEETEIKDIRIQELLKKYLIHALELVDNKLKNDIRKRQSKGAINAKGRNEKKKKGRPKKYSEDAENPYDREVYYTVISMLKEDTPISDIASELDLSRTTIYRIKDEMEKDDYTIWYDIIIFVTYYSSVVIALNFRFDAAVNSFLT